MMKENFNFEREEDNWQNSPELISPILEFLSQLLPEKRNTPLNILKAENDLKRIETEAKQRVAQAEAEARAIQIQAEAITQQGGKEYVNLKAVEKWNGVLPTQMIPNGTLPFINLDK